MTHRTPNDCSADGTGIILVAIDGSTVSLHAEAWAENLARKQGSRLLCLFVETHPAFAETALSTGAAIPMDFGQGELANEIFEQIRVDATAHHMHPEFLLRCGDPATEIERVADQFRVDAVVVGASTKARHRLIGSVARRLVHTGRWPVTVVP